MARSQLIGGTDVVRRVFATLKIEAAEKIARALILGALEIVRDAQVLVPVEDGDLKNTIHATITIFGAMPKPSRITSGAAIATIGTACETIRTG